MGRIWLVFWEIELIFRSKLAQIAETEEIGLENRSNLALMLQMGWIWLSFGEIDMDILLAEFHYA
jgi:hypothetical protein